MIEFEIYAEGLREGDRIMQLDSQLGTLNGLRYQIDRNHDMVYFEMEEPTTTLNQVYDGFRRAGLTPKFVGQMPSEFEVGNKTQKIT
ncbi:MAG: hypothetical protein AAGJ79_07090 [Verrucomicrobiota bacterium]